MRRHTRLLSLLAVGAAGAAAGAIPSLATGGTPPSTASFTASDFRWSANGGASTNVTIAPGGTVTFDYPSGTFGHNADFGAGLQPSTCTQTSGSDAGPVPPLPATPQGPGWSGTCTFADAGTYHFVCDVHPSMTGTIVVSATTPPPPTTTTTTPKPPTTTTGTTTVKVTGTTPKPSTTTPKSTAPTADQGVPGYTNGGGSSPASARPGAPKLLPARSVRLARTQRGARVRGSLLLRAGRWRLQVELLVPRSAIAAARRGRVRVGRLVKPRVGPGRVSFSVPVDARARRVLRRRHRLALRVAIVATDAAGHRGERTIPITLRAR